MSPILSSAKVRTAAIGERYGEMLVPRTFSLLWAQGAQRYSGAEQVPNKNTDNLLSLCLTFGKPEPRSARMKS